MQFFQRKTVQLSPGAWVCIIALAGCGLIALLAAAAAQSQIHTQIVMRRAWFNQSLRHYDLAYRDLHSIRNRMMDNGLWQSRMQEVLLAKKDWKQLGLTAAQLHEKGAATPEWIWNGWKAFLRIGWDTKADEFFRILNEPYMLEQIGSGRAELVKAYDLHLSGKQQEALEGIRRARKYGVEPPLLACLEAEWLTHDGKWKEAEGLLAPIPIDPQEGLARRSLSDAAIMLAKGQSVAALGLLDLFILQKGIPCARTDSFLDNVAHTAMPPHDFWASQTLQTWRRDRLLPINAPSKIMPDWRGASYPNLPDGRIIARITPKSLLRVDGKPLPHGKPLVAYESFKRLNLPEKAQYTIVLRGAVNRPANRGEIVVMQIPGQKAAATYFGSRQPAERRFTVHLSDGPTSLTIGSVPVWTPGGSGDGFWLHELFLIQRSTPPPLEDAGLRDCLVYDWKEWTSQKELKDSSAVADKNK